MSADRLRQMVEQATPPKAERWWQLLGRVRRCETCGKDLRRLSVLNRGNAAS